MNASLPKQGDTASRALARIMAARVIGQALAELAASCPTLAISDAIGLMSRELAIQRKEVIGQLPTARVLRDLASEIASAQ